MRKRVGTYIRKISIKRGPAYITHQGQATINFSNPNFKSEYFVIIPGYTLQPNQHLNLMAADDVKVDFLIQDPDSKEFIDIDLSMTTSELHTIEVRDFLVKSVWNQKSDSYQTEGFVLADLVF